MFEGDFFGVGLTVQPVGLPDVEGWAPAGGPATERPSRLAELMPVGSRDAAGLAAETRRANAAEASLWAYRLEMLVRLAESRPRRCDRADGRPGARSRGWAQSCWMLEEHSEFLADEVALIYDFSRGEATRLLAAALTLVHRLPATLAALADGELTWSRARAVAEEVYRCGPELDASVVATVEAVVLPEAAELSVTALRARLRGELVRRDEKAAEERRAQALQRADVFLRRSEHEGMCEVVARLPTAVGAAVLDAVDSHARAAKAGGDQRSIGMIRAEVAADLALRPWDASRPAVTAQLSVVASLRSLLADPASPGTPGAPEGSATVAGEPVTAAHLRALLQALEAIGAEGLRAPPGGGLRLDLLDSAGDLAASLGPEQLSAAVRRGCPEHGGADAGCACPVVGKPRGTDAYRPSPAQVGYVTSRDRGCRHPGCSSRSGWADLDHVVPHAEGGATDCDNLCCLCRRHHRLKTHAPGWRFALDPDGSVRVTTPSGVTRVSRPPGSYLLEPFELAAPLPEDADLVLDEAPFSAEATPAPDVAGEGSASAPVA